MDNKIIEALSKLLPEDQVKDVAAAISETLAEAKQELEAEYNKNLEEAYADLAKDMKEAEDTAEKGYQEAYAIIADLRNRLETQKAEFEAALDEGYEEAYQMLVAERGKNENIEVQMYEEYDKKLSEMKSYLVEMVTNFLEYQGQEIYEKARREVMSDPRIAEHKVAFDKIVETVSGFMSDEDHNYVTNSKLDDAVKAVDDLKSQMRILEARNIRLSTENGKLNEQVKQAVEVITESNKNEKKERVKTAQKVQGRGFTNNEKIVAEYSEQVAPTQDEANEEEENVIEEGFEGDELRQALILAGVAKPQ